MNQRISFLKYFLVLAFSLVIACDDDDNNDNNCIQVSGPIITEEVTVNSFHSISLRGIGDIYLIQGPTQKLEVETHQEVFDNLDISVSNETLTIDMRQCINGNIQEIDFFITIPDIRTLRVEGVGNVIAQNDFDLDALSIDLRGVGDFTLRGVTESLDITSSGVGNVYAFEMTADDCLVSVSGVGNIEVTVNNSLDVTISGAGNVYYKGQPTVNVNITGSGNINDAN